MPRLCTTLIIALCAGTLGPAVAETPDNSNRGAGCAQWRQLAGRIMHDRQNGVTMRDEQRALADRSGHATVESLISTAYDQPVFKVREKKTRAIDLFSRSVYSVCTRQHDPVEPS